MNLARSSYRGFLVDGIVEHREQPQTYLGGYDLTISGQHRRLSSNDAIELVSHPVRRLIARRAARELAAGASTNFGFGIPAVFLGLHCAKACLIKVCG